MNGDWDYRSLLAIITGMENKLYPVTLVYSGNLIYPASMAKAVIL